jgi:hypothetical protein
LGVTAGTFVVANVCAWVYRDNGTSEDA